MTINRLVVGLMVPWQMDRVESVSQQASPPNGVFIINLRNGATLTFRLQAIEWYILKTFDFL
jgi:hypothetical protein